MGNVIDCDFKFLNNKNIETDIEPFVGRCSIKNERRNKYKVDIQKNSILTKFYDKHLLRKSLLCRINDSEEKSAIVILMNPSYADESGLDGTLKNVYIFLNSNKYSQFEVLNIFPIRTAKSSCLPCLLQRYDKDGKYRKENLDYIRKCIQSKRAWDIIVAWGKDYHLSSEAQSVCKMLNNRKNIYAYNLNNNNTPSHFTSKVFNKITKRQLLHVCTKVINGIYYFSLK